HDRAGACATSDALGHDPEKWIPVFGRIMLHRNAGARYSLATKPRLVETIQKLPQRTIESTRPSPGTMSPRAARQTPSGPSSVAVDPETSRTVQPSMVVGRVSGTGSSRGKLRMPFGTGTGSGSGRHAGGAWATLRGEAFSRPSALARVSV